MPCAPWAECLSKACQWRHGRAEGGDLCVPTDLAKTQLQNQCGQETYEGMHVGAGVCYWGAGPGRMARLGSALLTLASLVQRLAPGGVAPVRVSACAHKLLSSQGYHAHTVRTHAHTPAFSSPDPPHDGRMGNEFCSRFAGVQPLALFRSPFTMKPVGESHPPFCPVRDCEITRCVEGPSFHKC